MSTTSKPEKLMTAGWSFVGQRWHYFREGEQISACDKAKNTVSARAQSPRGSDRVICSTCLTVVAQDAKARAIRHARLAVAMLNERSEALRFAIDNFESALNGLANTECALPKGQRIRDRLEQIRERRNGMECFQLQCLTNEGLDHIWKQLA